MTELQKQVRHAQRRINSQRFLTASVWSLAAAFLLAAMAIGVRKIWYLGLDADAWTWGWLGGSVAVGLISAALWTWLSRRGSLEAAIEIDRRFKLKERVSSSLSLSPEESETEIGRALVEDASRRVERIDVRDGFAVRASRWALLPLVTASIAIALVFLPDASKPGDEAGAASIQVKKQIKKSAEEAKKKLAKQRKEAEEKGLKEASDLIKKLEQGMDDLSKKENVDRKNAMVKMNDLAKELKQRRQALSGNDDLRKQLNQLKDMNIKQGPADRLAKALKDGDFKAALDQIAKLQQQLQHGELTPAQQEQMAEQMKQMQQKLQQIAKAHEKAQQELQQQIEQKKKQGDQAAADKLQKQLERLQQQNQQMQRMQQMANKMAECAKCLAQGQKQQAQAELAELAQNLEAMQQELEELQMLEEALNQLADAKDAMNCENCDGAGCQMCQGMGFGDFQQMPGMGMGEGQGRGDRPEEETGAKFYDSKVQAKPRSGKMVVIGQVRGPNAAGQAREAIKEALEAATSEDDDPLTGVRLPRAQREQVQQYFDAVRKGEN